MNYRDNFIFKIFLSGEVVFSHVQLKQNYYKFMFNVTTSLGWALFSSSPLNARDHSNTTSRARNPLLSVIQKTSSGPEWCRSRLLSVRSRKLQTLTTKTTVSCALIRTHVNSSCYSSWRIRPLACSHLELI
jgi:hypothetical protein